MAKKEFQRDKDLNNKSSKAGKKAKNFNRSKQQKGEDSCVEKRFSNDPTWYAANPQLLKDVASLPFSNMLGNAAGSPNTLFEMGDTTTLVDNPIYVPGILNVNLEPTLGCGRLATDAATVAARNLYSFVRHANSGHANYEAPDLLMYVIARISAECWVATLERLYGCMRTFSTRNRYFAQSVVESLGFNYQDMLSHIVDLRALINTAKYKLNTLAIPASMTIRDRWLFLCRNIFVDDDGSKPQIIVPRFTHLFRWSATTDEQGTELQLIYTNTGEAWNPYAQTFNLKFETIVSITNDLIDPIFSNEDCGIMSGDIIKAFGEGGLAQLTETPEDYTTLPVYDKEFLMQIHNAICYRTTWGEWDDVNIPLHRVKQRDGVIVEHLFATGDTGLKGGTLKEVHLDYYGDDVSPEAAMEMTRLTSIEIGDSPLYENSKSYVNTGSEIVRSFGIYLKPVLDSNNANDPSEVTECWTIINASGATTGGYGTVNAFQGLLAMSTFNYHPRIYALLPMNGQATEYKFGGILGDLENYSVVSTDVLTRMNQVAILAELNKGIGQA